MKIKICPKCKSDKIVFHAAAHTGMYQCQKCGYTGPIVLEQDIDEK